MIPAIGYMVGAYVFASFARWIKEDEGTPLIMLYVVGLLLTLGCLVWLTSAVAEANEALRPFQQMR